MVTVVPSPGADCSSIAPPWASTNWRASGRPRPTAASSPVRPSTVRLEPVEHPRLVGRGDAGAIVRDDDPGPLAVALGAEQHAAARRGVGKGVLEDIAERLAEPPRIAGDDADLGLDLGHEGEPAPARRILRRAAVSAQSAARSTSSSASSRLPVSLWVRSSTLSIRAPSRPTLSRIAATYSVATGGSSPP